MKHDGDPAFPLIWKDGRDGLDHVEAGMSLRDYFAAKAMQSILISMYGKWRPDQIAVAALRQADEMIVERNK